MLLITDARNIILSAAPINNSIRLWEIKSRIPRSKLSTGSIGGSWNKLNCRAVDLFNSF